VKEATYRSALAFHESGHAVAALMFDRPFYAVTIVATKGFEGALIPNAGLDLDKPGPAPDAYAETAKSASRDFLESFAIEMLAGPVAQAGHECLWNYPHYATDFAWAEEFASRAGQRHCSDSWLTWIWMRAVLAVADQRRWMQVEAVAEALLAKGTLLKPEVEAVALQTITRFDADAHDGWQRARKFLFTHRPLLGSWPHKVQYDHGPDVENALLPRTAIVSDEPVRVDQSGV
jgi:hypothetical protein